MNPAPCMVVNGPARAARTQEKVGADGESIRYQMTTHVSAWLEWAVNKLSIWVVPQEQRLLSHNLWDEGLFCCSSYKID